MLDMKDVFAAKLADKPIDIRSVKTSEQWLAAVQMLLKADVLITTNKENVFEVRHPLLGNMKKNPEHGGDEMILAVGSYVGIQVE